MTATLTWIGLISLLFVIACLAHRLVGTRRQSTTRTIVFSPLGLTVLTAVRVHLTRLDADIDLAILNSLR